jgi:hypothetical protein
VDEREAVVLERPEPIVARDVLQTLVVAAAGILGSQIARISVGARLSNAGGATAALRDPPPDLVTGCCLALWHTQSVRGAWVVKRRYTGSRKRK